MNAPRNVWLRSPLWDSVWILSGLWLIIPATLLVQAPSVLLTVLLVGTALLWLSHRFATVYSSFFTPAYRPLLRSQKTRFVLLPVAILTATILFCLAPQSVFGLAPLHKLQILGTIFFVVNTYHFGVQHYGVLSIYRIRAGQSSSDQFKQYECYFCIAVGGVLVAMALIGHAADVVRESVLSSFSSFNSFLE